MLLYYSKSDKLEHDKNVPCGFKVILPLKAFGKTRNVPV